MLPQSRAARRPPRDSAAVCQVATLSDFVKRFVRDPPEPLAGPRIRIDRARRSA